MALTNKPAIIALLLSLLAAMGPFAPCSVAEEVQWHTGPKFLRQMNLPASATYDGVPLRRAVQSLARANQVAVLIDRRVNPDREIKLTLTAPLRDVLEGIALAYNRTSPAGSEPIALTFPIGGGVAYLGPASTTRWLRTATEVRKEEVRNLPRTAPRGLVRLRPVQWRDLATPRELFEQAAEDYELEILGLDRIPHDLWAAADLPPLMLSDRLSILAAQFDLTFRLQEGGKQIQLDRVRQEDRKLQRSYPAGRDPNRLLAVYHERAPEADLKLSDGQITVIGRAEDHDLVRDVGGRETSDNPAATLANQRFTMNVDQQPVGALLNYLKQNLAGSGVELKVNSQAISQAGMSLDQRISFNIKDAMLDEFLRAALRPAGLKHRREGNTIHVTPAGE